jgi:anti-sigma factor RsiW
MNCAEFRRRAGTDPARLDAETEAHRAGCAACAEYHRSLLAMDATIRKALQVPLPEASPTERRSPVRLATASPPRPRPAAGPRWLALAASIVAGVLVGSLLWVSGPRETLAHELVEHVRHEPQSLSAEAADPGVVERVLGDAGVRLRAGAGDVSYARSCPFRGHEVPHLVVRTAHGPITVLVLRYQHLARTLRFEEQGLRGAVVPAGPGSIAIMGDRPQREIDEVTATLLAAVEFADGDPPASR